MSHKGPSHDPTPGYDGEGWRFEQYWCRGPGLARWASHPHPWTTLYRHLLKHVGNPAFAKRWDPLESTCRHASLSIL